jgi:hypothetical protein
MKKFGWLILVLGLAFLVANAAVGVGQTARENVHLVWND